MMPLVLHDQRAEAHGLHSMVMALRDRLAKFAHLDNLPAMLRHESEMALAHAMDLEAMLADMIAMTPQYEGQHDDE